MLILFIKSQLSLFSAPVHVAGTVRKDGTIVKPHIRIQKIAPKQPPKQMTLFGGNDETKPKPAKKTKLDAFIQKHGGLERLAGILAGMTEGQQQQIISGMATVGGKTPAEISAMFDDIKPQQDLFSQNELKDADEHGEVPQARSAYYVTPPKLDLPTIEHDGDTWYVLNTGSADEKGKVMAHLSSATRGRKAGNGVHPIQMNDHIDREKLGMVADESPEIVEHTTKRGKTLRGIVRHDLTQDEAKAIDEYTFKKDGGWFIREKHLHGQAKIATKQPETVATTKKEAGHKPEANGSKFGTLYHGTPLPFDTFRDPTASKDRGAGYDHQGSAIYLTDDPNGYGRFFARESGARLMVSLATEGRMEESRAVMNGQGVVMSVKLSDDAKILEMDKAPKGIKDLFDSSAGNLKIGERLRQSVLDAGYDGISFKEPNYPEGWEVSHNAHTTVIYNHDKATITGHRDAKDYHLPMGWTGRGEAGLANPDPAQKPAAPFGVSAGITKSARRDINAKVAAMVTSDKSDYSEEEKALLRQYSGNGGCGDSLNEFYTDPAVASAMWAVTQRLGVSGGTVLEPSCATGVFLHTAPEGFKVTGVEMDPISNAVAKVLHGDRHEIADPCSMERFARNDGGRQFSAVLGNPPYGPRGSLAKDDKPNIKSAEAYFIDTALDKCAPGGIVSLVIPASVMNNKNGRAFRERILRKSEFLGAQRMPNTAFEASHTDVTADIIWLRKRPDDVAGALMTVDKAKLKEIGVWDDEFLSGKYFEGRGAANVFGTAGTAMRSFGEIYTVNGSMAGVPEAIAKFEPHPVGKTPTVQDVVKALGDDEKAVNRAMGAAMVKPYEGGKAGDTKVVDGVTYILQGKPLRWHRVDEFLQSKDVSEGQEIAGDIDRLMNGKDVNRPELEEKIRAYVEKHGIPGQNNNLQTAAFTDRTLYRLIGAVNDDGTLSDAVTGKAAAKPAGTFDTVAQSLAMEREGGAFSALDLSERLAKDNEEIEDALFASPAYAYLGNGQFTTMDQFLTGELWPKLDDVKAQLGREDLQPGLREKYTLQAKLLEDTIDPKSLEDVEVMLNSAFLPTDIIAAYFNERKNASHNDWIRQQADMKVMFDNGVYTFEGGNKYGEVNLLDKYLNRTGVRKDDLPQVEAWNEDFKQWLLSSRYRDEVEELYNRNFRGFVQAEYSDATIDIPGMKTDGLKQYQYSGLRWALAAGKGIIAADVGLGKTVRGLMLARMAKLNGTAQKPTFVVPKSVLANWVAESEKWFPGSRIMVIGETYTKDKDGNIKGKEDTAATRNRKLHELTQNDYDFVFISQPAFNDVDLDPITKGEYLNDDFWVQRGDSLGNAGDKRINRVREAYNQAVANREFQKRTDAIYFNDLGIDMLVVDEMHAYKNLYAAKNRYGESPKFLGGQGLSNRALDMNFKARWIRENNGGKGIFGLTATPTKNSPLEIYSMLSHIAPEAFERIGIRNSEEFLDRFCDFKNEKILGTDGTIQDALVTAGFKNMDELREIMKRFIDRKTAADVGLKLPSRNDQMHMIDMTEDQSAVYADLRTQMQEASNKDAEGDAHIFSIMDKMAKAAMDLELLDPNKHAGAHSPKYAEAAKHISENSKDGGQVVFAESVASHEKIANELVKSGIPRDQIAIINAQAASSSTKRQKIANDFNTGKIKVVIGNKTMEEGINLQKRTTDIHHLDLPWEPASMQQRNGRGLRQGNINEAIRIHTYLSKGSFDGYRYQSMMAKKDWQDLLWNGGDRVHNLSREGVFDRSDLMIMMSADPEAERAKFESDKAAAQERYEGEQRTKAAAEFTRLQIMNRSYNELKNKKSDSAERLRNKIERAKTLLANNEYFSAKAALTSNTPVVLHPSTGLVMQAGAGIELHDGDAAGKWVVTGVDPATAEVTMRRYAQIGKDARKITVHANKLGDQAKAFKYSEADEGTEVAKKIEDDAKANIDKAVSLSDIKGMPSNVLSANHAVFQDRLKQGLKDYKWSAPYGGLGMIDREGNPTVYESYEVKNHLDTHDIMLPTQENKDKAVAAYIADQRARGFRMEYNSSGRRRHSTPVGRLVESYPGKFDQKTNRWKSVGNDLFGQDFEKEAHAKFTTVQSERIRRAPNLTQALLEAAPMAEFNYSSEAKWPKRALAVLFAKAKRGGDLDRPFNEVQPMNDSRGTKIPALGNYYWDKYGHNVAENKTVSSLLVDLAKKNNHHDLAAAMVVSSSMEPKEKIRNLLQMPYLTNDNVTDAIHHVLNKHPDLGDLKGIDFLAGHEIVNSGNHKTGFASRKLSDTFMKEAA